MGELRQMRSPQKDVHDTLNQAADALEVIANLNYLICDDAHNPDAVRDYADESQSAVRKLAHALQMLAQKRLDSAA